jgi:hypothetical protein
MSLNINDVIARLLRACGSFAMAEYKHHLYLNGSLQQTKEISKCHMSVKKKVVTGHRNLQHDADEVRIWCVLCRSNYKALLIPIWRQQKK